MSRRVGVLTGSSNSSGIQAFLWRLTQQLESRGVEAVGFEEGWRGVVEGRYRALRSEELRPLVFQAGSSLLTSRTDPLKDGTLSRALDRLAEARVDALVAVGGTETLAAAAAASRMGVRVVGVPQAVENDVIGTESCIGFPTAAQRGVEMVCAALSSTWPDGCNLVVEVPGRQAGWLALRIGVDTFADAVLIPELPAEPDSVAGLVKESAASGRRAALVVVAEGVPLGETAGAAGAGVGHALAGYLREETGRDVRVQVLGDALRGGPPSERDLWHANLFADRVAELIEAGRCGVMAGLQGGRIVEVPLERAAGGVRQVTPEWLEFARKAVGAR
ncbi:MAG: 6-phosphofructokinase [Bacillota bacterium]